MSVYNITPNEAAGRRVSGKGEGNGTGDENGQANAGTGHGCAVVDRGSVLSTFSAIV